MLTSCFRAVKKVGLADSLKIGQFSFNFIVTDGDSMPGMSVHRALSDVLPKVKYLPLDLETLNGSRLCPKMDYESGRLLPGSLQLSPGTHLVVDETRLLAGQLQDAGGFLGTIIEWRLTRTG